MQKRENKKRGKYFDVSIALHGIYDGAFTVYMKIHSSIPVLLECICPLTVCKRNTKLWTATRQNISEIWKKYNSIWAPNLHERN